ncbi:restriction endonuclease subunit S [Epilithonimonas sp. UC225_85]|uniref:restriction endonuclease subunit S n=1 Tax=Epilithonimonas sp. UC225_85 TaxID=3350167 RepID=UPI0036D32A78
MTEKNKSIRNFPNLRFPGFEECWELKKLKEVASKINSGKTPLGGEAIYTVSGVVFIRSQNVNHDRLVLDNPVFIPDEINRGMKNSVVYPNDILLNITGASLGRSCVVPENFIIGNVNQHVCVIRSTKKYNPRFIQPILSSTKGQDVFKSLQTGSGREGLNFESIKNIKIFYPSLTEQNKIANFLSLLDDRMQTQKKIIDDLIVLKNSAVKKLFESNIKFKNDNGNFPNWEKKKLNEISKEHLQKNPNNLYTEVFSVSKHKGVINQIEHLGRSFSAKEITHYKLIYPGDLVYTKSPTSEFPFGIIKQNRTGRIGVVSPLYCVFTPDSFALGYLIHEYFNSPVNTFNYLNPLVQKGAKNTMNINNDAFLNGAKLLLPINKEEQNKIYNFLYLLEDKINLEKKIITQFENQKKYLLANLFI